MTLRRSTVEHPFGTIKAWMGTTHFLMRRLKNVRAEMALNVLAYNIKRNQAHGCLGRDQEADGGDARPIGRRSSPKSEEHALTSPIGAPLAGCMNPSRHKDLLRTHHIAGGGLCRSFHTASAGCVDYSVSKSLIQRLATT